MKVIKRISGVLVAAVMVFQLSGCLLDGSLTTDLFDDFLNEVPSQLISSADMNMNYMFKDPGKFGLEKGLLELPYMDKAGYEESKKEINDLLTRLSGFKYSELNEDQKLTRDILKDYLERQLLTIDSYELDNSYLGSFIGFQAQLPMLLNEFSISDKKDLDSYFNILSTADETFQKYAALEREYQEKGTGMGTTIMGKVIEQCENLSKGDNSYLVDSMNQKIDDAGFLNDNEKTEAKEKNADLVNNKFVPAYKALGETLKGIEIKSSDLGLSTKPGGKEYYAALLKQRTGIDDSVEDIKAYFEGKLQQEGVRMYFLMQKNPELQQLADLANMKYCDFTTAEQNIDYLAEQLPKHYPAVDNLIYKVTKVPEAMAENFSPAAYLVAALDKPEKDPQAIYINGDYEQSLYPTIAHEGYPGHMYQNTFFQSLKLPLVRYMVDYNGYSEGWANYVQHNSWQFAPAENKTLLEFADLNERMAENIIALADIGIHYEGWTRDQFKTFMKTYGFELPEQTLNDQFNLNLETPTNYLQYYLNSKYYQDLYDETKVELGTQFNEIEFHRVLLETGPSSFSILEQQVKQFVDTVKSGEESQSQKPAA